MDACKIKEAVRNIYDGFNSRLCFISLDKDKHGDGYANLKEELILEFCDALMSSGVFDNHISSTEVLNDKKE